MLSSAVVMASVSGDQIKELATIIAIRFVGMVVRCAVVLMILCCLLFPSTTVL